MDPDQLASSDVFKIWCKILKKKLTMVEYGMPVLYNIRNQYTLKLSDSYLGKGCSFANKI